MCGAAMASTRPSGAGASCIYPASVSVSDGASAGYPPPACDARRTGAAAKSRSACSLRRAKVSSSKNTAWESASNRCSARRPTSSSPVTRTRYSRKSSSLCSPSKNSRHPTSGAGMISVASEYRNGSRNTRPGLSETGDGKKSSSVRSLGSKLQDTGSVTASEHYQARLQNFLGEKTRAEKRFRGLGNLRGLVLVIAIAIGGIGFGPGWTSPWWLVAPVAASIALVVAHDRVEHERSRAARGMAYYERAIGRLSNQWIGTGNQGDRFRDSKHVYADDLDLFGRGSLFEMLSTARTGAGESALAAWLLTPGDRSRVMARQQAVEELRDRVDLREELALMGEDNRAAGRGSSGALG